MFYRPSGIPGIFNFILLIVAISLILCAGHYLKLAYQENKLAGVLPQTLARKKKLFGILLLEAFIICAAGHFWLSRIVPNGSLFIGWIIPFLSFLIVAGMLWYSLFKKKL
jgi:apolipoprotein N-acyltransferase